MQLRSLRRGEAVWMILGGVAALLLAGRPGPGLFPRLSPAASLSDPSRVCEGIPILLSHPFPGTEGPFEECAFQCAVSERYYLVYADRAPDALDFRAVQCGKDPSVLPGSACTEGGRGAVEPCVSDKIAGDRAAALDVYYAQASSSLPSGPSSASSSNAVSSSRPAAAVPPLRASSARASSIRSTPPSAFTASSSSPPPWELTFTFSRASDPPSVRIPLPRSLETQSEAADDDRPFCGNGVVEPHRREECDEGEENGKPDVPCTASCRMMAPAADVLSESASSSSRSSSLLPHASGAAASSLSPLSIPAPIPLILRPAAPPPTGIPNTSSPASLPGATGPAAIALMAAGAAGGWAWVRRKHV